ncbi:hypothetical protein LSH36_442g03066 [Paralvinella palmiformis]|uniref:Uncharacterized protein n=1 Tax=Paralvinella palmiformis TaxID=53620 RepID=A0AAD9JC26_9ANNE|nr:hypothetical protein LSH36_442g03066 [Paralvinella palmiformis]
MLIKAENYYSAKLHVLNEVFKFLDIRKSIVVYQ